MSNTNNWYNDGLAELHADIAETIVEMLADGQQPLDIAEVIYSGLKDDGLIDYDTEKDIFYEWSITEEDRDEY